MKTKLLFLSFFMLTSAFVSHAQDIAVQTPANTTIIYHDINLALYNAPAGSTVFLPAGAFEINDTIKVNKTLSIVGCGYKFNNEISGTQIKGNICLGAGSDNSSIMGLYMINAIVVAETNTSVNNIYIAYNNLDRIHIQHNKCNNIEICQNYLRSGIYGGESPIYLHNNIARDIEKVNGGLLCNNIVFGAYYNWDERNSYTLYQINNSVFKNNIIMGGSSLNINDCLIQNNMTFSDNWGMNCLYLTNLIDQVPSIDAGWTIVFNRYNGWDQIMTNDYHLKSNIGKNAGTDGTDLGIYGGTGFSDAALPPYPQITFKNVPGQTDEYGNLKIQVKVRAQ